MSFSDRARTALIKAKNQFGEYSYYDKGACEVMDVDDLVRDLKRLSVANMIAELKHLASRTDCPLEPDGLIRSILGSLDDDATYDALFEDEELMEYY